VRRIFCIGRNYAAHAVEMGHSAKEPPFHFIKSADSAWTASGPAASSMAFPPGTDDLQHEVELVVAVGTAGRNLTVPQASAAVFAHGVGVDLTRRDLQAAAKRKRRPWSAGKDFDGAAPVGELTLGPPPGAGVIELSVNGETRQRGDIADMIWSVPELLCHLSTLRTLRPGDLVFTGTPAGVGTLESGDVVVGSIAGVGCSVGFVVGRAGDLGA